MIGFVGKSHCKLDSKNRLLIPSKFAKFIPQRMDGETGVDVVVNRSFDKCINIYTPDEWDRVKAPYENLNPLERENRILKRMFFEFADGLTFDSNGRINMSSDLLDFAGIKKEVILLGYSENILEMWDVEIYELMKQGSQAGLEDLSRKLLSSNPTNPNRVSEH